MENAQNRALDRHLTLDNKGTSHRQIMDILATKECRRFTEECKTMRKARKRKFALLSSSIPARRISKT